MIGSKSSILTSNLLAPPTPHTHTETLIFLSHCLPLLKSSAIISVMVLLYNRLVTNSMATTQHSIVSAHTPTHTHMRTLVPLTLDYVIGGFLQKTTH